MKKNLFVKDLRPKSDIEELFLVKYLAVMESRDGKNYLNMVLTDSSGDLESRKWQGAREISDKISVGDYVKAKGKVNLYQGRVQLVLQSVEKIDQALIEVSDYVAKAEVGPEKMFNDLVAIVSKLDDVYIKDLINAILFDSEIQRRLKVWQAGKTIHHAYMSGLLEHILSCANLAITLSDHYKVNKNYVVAGAIMHDLCKIYELTEGPVVEYTEEGKLVGHLVKILELIDHFSSKIPSFPYNLKTHLKHIMLSHHGEYEYGSPKVPQTSEAFLVHLIDLMDSKMSSLETIKKQDKTPGRWSGFVKHLDRVIYKEELPFYRDYIKKNEADKNVKASNKKNNDKTAKTSMASLFDGIEIESKD